jgi:ferritin heavy chain
LRGRAASLSLPPAHQPSPITPSTQPNLLKNTNSDDVALKGFAAYFAHESLEERAHAQKLMDFQTRRGGRVKLGALAPPETEFGGPAAAAGDKGDALYAMELALSLEKLNWHKLRALHAVADEAGDAHMADFVEGDLLADQAASVQTVSEYVAQLRRVGKGLGVFEFDRKLADAV